MTLQLQQGIDLLTAAAAAQWPAVHWLLLSTAKLETELDTKWCRCEIRSLTTQVAAGVTSPGESLKLSEALAAHAGCVVPCLVTDRGPATFSSSSNQA